jgi:hypothetical protein
MDFHISQQECLSNTEYNNTLNDTTRLRISNLEKQLIQQHKPQKRSSITLKIKKVQWKSTWVFDHSLKSTPPYSKKCKNFNDYFKCTQLMWYSMQRALHCLIPREEDFLM